jgi:uncharacterized protein
MNRFRERFAAYKVLIGVSHLPPLPDYPASPGIDAVCAHALADIAVLQAAGLDAVLLENEGDQPHRVLAAAETEAAMLAVTRAACARPGGFPVGCEILLNDPRASLRVAVAAGAEFIRTDYFVDRMSRPGFGEFAIDPEALLAYRRELRAENVLILADIQVKYARMLEPRPLRESARLAAVHGADAVVVSGDATGSAPSATALREARDGIREAGIDVPVLIGSGLDPHNAIELLANCDGAIVGTSLMSAGKVSAGKARALADIVASLRA